LATRRMIGLDIDLQTTNLGAGSSSLSGCAKISVVCQSFAGETAAGPSGRREPVPRYSPVLPVNTTGDGLHRDWRGRGTDGIRPAPAARPAWRSGKDSPRGGATKRALDPVARADRRLWRRVEAVEHERNAFLLHQPAHLLDSFRRAAAAIKRDEIDPAAADPAPIVDHPEEGRTGEMVRGPERLAGCEQCATMIDGGPPVIGP
jgi:hypothetical protein